MKRHFWDIEHIANGVLIIGTLIITIVTSYSLMLALGIWLFPPVIPGLTDFKKLHLGITLTQAVTMLSTAIYGLLWKQFLPQSWSKLGLLSFGWGALLTVGGVILVLFAAYTDFEVIRLAFFRHLRAKVDYVDLVFWIATFAIAVAYSAFGIATIYLRHSEAERTRSIIPPSGRIQKTDDGGYTFIFFEEHEHLVSVSPRCKKLLPLLDDRWWLIVRVAAWSGPDIFFAFSATRIAKALDGKLGLAVQMFDNDEELADSDVPCKTPGNTPMWAFYKDKKCRFKANGIAPEDWLKRMALYLIHYNENPASGTH